MASSITINLGDAFLLDTPPNSEHLYIAIAQTSDTDYLFVNVLAADPTLKRLVFFYQGKMFRALLLVNR
jgi:hypothetical protein